MPKIEFTHLDSSPSIPNGFLDVMGGIAVRGDVDCAERLSGSEEQEKFRFRRN